MLLPKSGVRGLFVFLILIGCRDEEEKIFASIEGKWRGTLAELRFKPLGLPIPISEEDESFAARLEFTSEGVLQVYEGGQQHTGTYQRINDKLVIDIDLDVSDVEFSGTYTIDALDETKLVFYKEESDKIADPDGGLAVSGKIKVTLHFERI